MRSESTYRPAALGATLAVSLLVMAVMPPCPAVGLDLFTLWRQPMIPLHMIPGSWADYKLVTLEQGRQSENLLRVQCVERIEEAPRGWIVELLHLQEVEDGLVVVPGEGLRLYLSDQLLRRDSELAQVVQKVVRWQAGEPRELLPAEWRDDPLVQSSLTREFVPDEIAFLGETVRVARARKLDCDQFQLTAADTQVVDLPRGRLEQITHWEVTAAVSADIPFLGIAYAAERSRAESRLDPPSDRFTPPPPVTRIETMELIAFGNKAIPALVAR